MPLSLPLLTFLSYLILYGNVALICIKTVDAQVTPSLIPPPPPDAYSSVTTAEQTEYPWYLDSSVPLPPELHNRITRFGCSAAISRDGRVAIGLAVDKVEMRQVAIVMTREDWYTNTTFLKSNGEGTNHHWTPLSYASAFYGDKISDASGFMEMTDSAYSRGSSCPICVSSNGDMFIIGGWMTETVDLDSGTTTTTLIAAKQIQAGRPDRGYTFASRLVSYIPNPRDRYFGSDLVCTANLSHVFIAEEALSNATSGAITFSIRDTDSQTERYLDTWTPNFGQFYNPTDGYRSLRMAISGDDTLLAIKQTQYDVQFFDTSNFTNTFTLSLQNVTDPPLEILTLALSYEAQIFAYSTQGTVFLGERYVHVVEYSETLGNYDLSTDLILIDPKNTSFTAWGAGTSLSFAPNPNLDTLFIGLPNFPYNPTYNADSLQTGAAYVFQKCPVAATETTGAYTSWVPGQTIFKPLVPGIPLSNSLGASYTSHNSWPSDGSVLLVSSPMSAVEGPDTPMSTGRIFVFSQVIPECPVTPISPTPQSGPALTPIQIVTQNVLTTAIVFAGIGLGLFLFGAFILLITKLSRS